jgi:hypothetical protein
MQLFPFKRFLFVLFLVFPGGTILSFGFPAKNHSIKIEAMIYKELWKSVDSLNQIGLYRDASAKVEFIYRKAKEERETEQIIKALFYIVHYLNELEIEGKILGIKRLENELQGAGYPENALLHSILAELYADYLKMNSWSLMGRKEAEGPIPEDLNLWSIRNFEDKISFHFFKSVGYARATSTDLKEIDALLLKPRGEDFVFHTLFDLLVYRATSFFSNNSSILIKPEDTFVLRDSLALAPLETFISIDFQTTDSSSFIRKALLLYQEILRFHQSDENPEVLLDFDLQRIKFVHQNLIHPHKHDLYVQQLNHVINKYPEYALTAEMYYLLANEQFRKSSLVKARSLCRFAIQKFPKSPGASLCRELLNTIEEKHLSLTFENQTQPNSPILIKIAFKNVSSFKGGVVPVSFKEYVESSNISQEEEVKKFLKFKTPIKELAFSLPDSIDYQQHETEIFIEGLNTGSYLFVFEGAGMLPSFIPFQISNIGYFVKNEGFEKIDFQFFNKETSLPLAGTRVLSIPVRTGYFSPRFPQVTFDNTWKICDENGFLSYSLPNGSFDFKIANGSDTLLLEDHFYISEAYKNEVQLQLKTSIFSDRKLYRPGQNIYFKALLMEKQSHEKARISPNREVTISLNDANGMLLSQMSLISNEMGSVSGSFLLPTDHMKGNYSLVSSHGGIRENIQVEDYKRPQFEIEFDKSPAGVLGDSLEIKGFARFFSNVAVENAQVRWEISRKSGSDAWPYIGRFYSRDPGYFLAAGETVTDKTGLFRFPFYAAPDRSVEPDLRPAFQFTIKVSITAPSGEIQEKILSFQLGYAKINVHAEIPENWDKQKGALDWSLFLSDWNGNAIKGGVKVSLLKLKAPRQHFVKRKWPFPDRPILNKETYWQVFPYLPYQGEDDKNQWEVSNTISEEFMEFEGDRKINIPFEKLSTGQYLMKLLVPEGSSTGKDKEIKKWIYLFDSGESSISTPKWLDIYLEKETLKISDTLVFKIAAAEEIKRVLIQFTTKNNVFKEWINPKEKPQIKIPLVDKEEGLGKLELLAWFRNEPIFIHKEVTITDPPEKLNVSYHRFTDKVSPGESVAWEVNISTEKGQNRFLEGVATLFDASLETLMPHSWHMNLFWYDFPLPPLWNIGNTSILSTSSQAKPSKNNLKIYRKYYPALNDFHFLGDKVYLRGLTKRQMAMNQPALSAFKESAEQIFSNKELDLVSSKELNPIQSPVASETVVRNDFSETVFFQPSLLTDEKGNMKIIFKMKDALTRWKFMLFAHQSDLNHVYSEKFIVSRLPVMIQTNAPRFLREGDECNYSVVLTNTTAEDVKGNLRLTISNGSNGSDITGQLSEQEANREHLVPAGTSIVVLLPLKIPAKGNLNQLDLILKFESAQFSDAIKESLPILPAKIRVTEAKPFILRESQTIRFKLSPEEATSTGRNSFEFQLTTHPVWIALKSLPYLMEYPYDGNEQVFNKMYANVLGTHLLTQYPTISNVLDEWKNSGALVSPLEENESLKSALLKETPWISDAANEKEQRQNMARLLDVSKMTYQVNRSIKTLSERQAPDGSWGWFPGGRGNWYITQYILSGWGKLKKLGLLDRNQPSDLINRALDFCDARMIEAYSEIVKNKKDDVLLPDIIVHYLYAQSFFKERAISRQVKEAMNYFSENARRNWLKMSVYQQGQLAVFWFRSGDRAMSEKVLNSLKDRALSSPELGMFWKLEEGPYWYQNKIEIQSLLIEAFTETGAQAQILESLKWALIQNKRTNHWETTKETADAIFALLGGGSEKMVERNRYPVRISFSDQTKKEIPASLSEAFKNSEVATGFLQKRWNEEDLAGEKGEMFLENMHSGIIWGAVIWQYDQEITEIKDFNSPFLSVSRTLFIKKINKSGEVLLPITKNNEPGIGDRLIVRLVVKADRDMEFVHVKDRRAAGIEPETVLSGYKSKEGLYYYESSSDSGTDFFIDFLPKGTHILDYPVKINAGGIYSLGSGTVQCMYAPEFGSHTKGEKIYIGK